MATTYVAWKRRVDEAGHSLPDLGLATHAGNGRNGDAFPRSRVNELGREKAFRGNGNTTPSS
jgi:hypothetical protein